MSGFPLLSPILTISSFSILYLRSYYAVFCAVSCNSVKAMWMKLKGEMCGWTSILGLVMKNEGLL